MHKPLSRGCTIFHDVTKVKEQESDGGGISIFLFLVSRVSEQYLPERGVEAHGKMARVPGAEQGENFDVKECADRKADHVETYDEWFLRQAQVAGLDRVSNPDAKWFSHEEALKRSDTRRAQVLARIAKGKSD